MLFDVVSQTMSTFKTRKSTRSKGSAKSGNPAERPPAQHQKKEKILLDGRNTQSSLKLSYGYSYPDGPGGSYPGL